jgi:Zn-dependent peptidase ImmA (M78 family)
LSATEHSENRLRTTITHELGHVRFHRFLFDGKAVDLDLFQLVLPPPSLAESDEKPQKCHQHSILHAGQVDWMEWQAGHACGGFLMPASHLRPVVAEYLRRNRILKELDVATSEAGELIQVVAGTFGVSREASRIRLLKMGHLVESSPSRSIFDR